MIGQKIVWKFNPSSSPWISRSWKSIVKITKKCLANITKDRHLTYEALLTFSAKIEATLNSRRLAQTSDDINEFNRLKSLEICTKTNKDVLETFHMRISTTVTNM